MSLIHGIFPEAIPVQHLLDEIPLSAMLLDAKRRIILVNRAMEALTGFTRLESSGVMCAHILRNAVCMQQCPLENPAGLEQEGPACLEGNIINRERRKIPVRITVVPVRDGQGICQGFLETVEDLRRAGNWNWKGEHAYHFGHLIGNSPQMEKIFQTLPMVGQTDSSVLITGETGTGKDLVAEAIHLASDRAKGSFIKVNCGALPETLLESELFGHQKGAFTGAMENKPGRFRLAHNGTLFLTEIGDLPLALQTKLLTFLDDKTVYPLGSSNGTRVNVRIIAATLRDLEDMVRTGQFRSDLLFRLNVIRIHLPSLRERDGDIRLLLDQFLRSFASQGRKKGMAFSPEALLLLTQYRYPGNVRELKNIVEYAMTFCTSGVIQPEHLPEYVLRGERLEPEAQAPEHPCSGQDQSPFTPKGQAPGTWKDIERQIILDALSKARGKRGPAAEILGWGRSTLWRKMKLLGLDG
jgi:two-component system, NtrC family, response regulator AtoC